ncbi:alcohol dehydrogenase [Agromyces sp. Root81]|uniref:alcohol dehydrogenase catalytic domain-containing protein n=1 Tax=Agromyces sp. Root81 TaxID=1736601 RepID=UPI0006FB256F|nr:alcohol dehydrogenase catalytic domain-containing protein [Agromyces sp. Root81]KRC61671.1 alcohol dehydrogenase [Agromyces sp. Root81]
MRSAVLRAQGAARPYAESRPLAIEPLDVAAPRPGEVGVRIERASLCHSDLSVVNGSRPRPLPMALGHEAAGIVEAVGDGVDGIAVGDHVVLVFVPSCGDCRECRSGRPALCSRAAEANGSGELLHGASVLTDAAGAPVNHHLGVSAFAEYAVVAAESLVVIDRDVPFDIAAMFGCAALTGMGAVFNTADVRPGQSVIVFGLGAVGLAAVMAAAQIEDVTVIAVDPNTDKHELALRAGANAVAAPDGAAALVAELTGGGIDVAIEAVGSARVMGACLELLARGGALVSVGLPHPEQELAVPALQFAGAGKRLLGSYMGDAVPARDIARYVELWRAGRLPMELLHTDTVPLAEINESLDALADGRVIRRLFVPNAA